MKIHFVSYGHVFRSRLAEAYIRYLLRKQPQYQITSSGIKYDKSIHGPIAWYAMKLLADQQLTGFMTDIPVLTTKALLEEQDVVIFMDDISKEFCERHFGYRSRTAEVWRIDYVPATPEGSGKSWEKDAYLIYISEQIFKAIQHDCQHFVDELNHVEVPFQA